MTNEEIGAYLLCLLVQASKGMITEKHMLNICKRQEVHDIVKNKFLFNKELNGLENIRLKTEIEKRKKYSESRSNNRKGKTKEVKSEPILPKSYENHMENENEIINNSLLSTITILDDKKSISINKITYDLSEDKVKYISIASQFQKLFIKNLKEKGSPISKQEKVTYKDYVSPIRLIFEKDKATKEQLLEAYNFLNSAEGEFWKSIILSTSQLRDKLDVLIAKKNTKTNIDVKKESLAPDPSKRKGF